MLKTHFKTFKKPLWTLIVLTLLLTFIPFEGIIMNNLNPLIFGTVFFLVNRQILNHNIFIGFILTIVASYAAFFTGLFSLWTFASIAELISNEIFDTKIFIVLSGLFASLTLYLFFTKIYETGQIKKGIIIMTTSYLLVPILVTTISTLFHKTQSNDFFTLYNLFWLLVVGFFMTLTTNFEKNKVYVVD